MDNSIQNITMWYICKEPIFQMNTTLFVLQTNSIPLLSAISMFFERASSINVVSTEVGVKNGENPLKE